MAVHLRRTSINDYFDVTGHDDGLAATHVAFAIDDLEQLADDILANVITVAIDDVDYARFRAAVFACLRGTTTGTPDDGAPPDRAG